MDGSRTGARGELAEALTDTIAGGTLALRFQSAAATMDFDFTADAPG
jgi:hypothetical protein